MQLVKTVWYIRPINYPWQCHEFPSFDSFSRSHQFLKFFFRCRKVAPSKLIVSNSEIISSASQSVFLRQIKSFLLLKAPLILKRLGGNQLDRPLASFQKIYILERGWSPTFLWLVIINYIFLENFIGISQAIQKIWRFFSSKIAIFLNYLLSEISLLQKILITSAYNRWSQHFFTFKLILISWLIIVESYSDIGLVLHDIWNRPQNKLPLRCPFLLGLKHCRIAVPLAKLFSCFSSHYSTSIIRR